MLSPDAAKAWFAAFCEHPAIYYGFILAAATHQDAIENRSERSVQPKTIIYKTRMMRLVRQALYKPAEFDTEILILAILLLWRNDDAPQPLATDTILQISPHLPRANWLSMYGRSSGASTHFIPMMALVESLGGTLNVKFPGMLFLFTL